MFWRSGKADRSITGGPSDFTAKKACRSAPGVPGGGGRVAADPAGQTPQE